MAATNTLLYNPLVRPLELLGEALECQAYGRRVVLVGAFRLVEDFQQFAVVTMVRSPEVHLDGTVYYHIQFIIRSNFSPNEYCVIFVFKTNTGEKTGSFEIPADVLQTFKSDKQARVVFTFVMTAIYTAFRTDVHLRDSDVLLATNATNKEKGFVDMTVENVPIPRRYSSLVPRVWAPPCYEDSRTPKQIVLSCRVCKLCGKVEAKRGQLSRCSGCNFVFYCGEACQRSDRKNHRELCKQEVEKYKKINK